MALCRSLLMEVFYEFILRECCMIYNFSYYLKLFHTKWYELKRISIFAPDENKLDYQSLVNRSQIVNVQENIWQKCRCVRAR